jgi:hypothetical protein
VHPDSDQRPRGGAAGAGRAGAEGARIAGLGDGARIAGLAEGARIEGLGEGARTAGGGAGRIDCRLCVPRCAFICACERDAPGSNTDGALRDVPKDGAGAGRASDEGGGATGAWRAAGAEG